MMGGNFGGAGAMDPELVQQILQATQGQQGGGQLSQLVPQLPQLPWSQATQADPGLAPATAAAVGRLTQPQGSGTLLPAEAGGVPGDNAYGQGSQFWQASNQGQPNDAGTAMDAIKTVVGLPFGLLRAGREGLEDIIGHPNSQRRQQQDAYIQAVNALPANQRALLGLPANDQGTLGMSSSAPVATGQPSTLGQNLQDSRQPGFIEWAQNLGRDVRQQKLAQIQAAMKLQAGVGKLQHLGAETFQANAGGINSLSSARKTGIEADQQAQYGPQKWQGEIADLLARVQASRAAAGASGAAGLASTALAGKYGVETQGARDANVRNEDQYWNVTRPAGDESLTQLRDKTTQGREGFSLWSDMQKQDALKAAAETAKLQQETTTSATGANFNVARTNQITDNAAGVPSGHGLAQLGREDTARRTEYIKATTGVGSPNGAPTMDKADAARALGFSVTPGAHFWNSDTVNLDSDPVGFRAAQSALSTQAPSSGHLPFQQVPSPGQPPQTARDQDQGGPASPMTRGSGADVTSIYRVLKGTSLGSSEASIVTRANDLAKILPSLDRSKGPVVFFQGAKDAGLTQAEAQALWKM